MVGVTSRTAMLIPTLFEFEQPALPPDAPAIAAQRTILRDDTMTWYQQVKPVRAIGAGDRAHGGGRANLLCDGLVAGCLAERDAPQFPPDTRLKRRAAQLHRHGELLPRAIEILPQLGVQLVEDGIITRQNRQLESAAHLGVTLFQATSVGELQL